MAEFVCNLIPDYPDVPYDSDDYSGECLLLERVVRCRDCIHASPYTDCRDEGEWLDCLHFAEWDYYADVPGHYPVRPDFFCAHGETVEDE